MRAPEEDIFVGGAGTPLRFLISMAGHAPRAPTVITGNTRMQERPMGDLLAALPAAGRRRRRACAATAARRSASPAAPSAAAATQISGAVCSQFTSSLIINALRAEQDTEIAHRRTSWSPSRTSR